MSIRLRLILIFLAISVVPVIVLSVLSATTGRDALRSSIGRNFQTIAQEKARIIEEIFQARIAEAEILATHPIIIAAVTAANAVREKKPVDVNVSEIMAIDKAWISSKGDIEIAAEIRSNSVSKFLYQYQQRDPRQYGEIFLTDVMGANLGMTKTLTDYYQADESWWKSGFNEGKGGRFIDDRGFDESVGAVVTGVVVPILDGARVAGVLKVNLKIQDIIDIISTGSTGKGEEVFLARARGDVILSSHDHKNRVLSIQEQKIVKGGQSGWEEDTHLGSETIMGYSPVTTEIYSRQLPKEGVLGVKGEAWQKTGWVIFVEIPTLSAYAGVTNLVELNAVVGGGVAILVIGLALWFVGFLTRPIDELRNGMAVVAGGQLDYHLETERHDEIGDLARSFTDMTSKLNQTLASREELNLSEKRFRTLVEHTSVVAWELDWSTFLFTYVSPHAEKLLGYPLDEWKVGGFWADHIYPEDKEETVSYCVEQSKSGQDHDFEYRMVKADGEPIWLRDIVTVNMGPEGVPVSLSGFMVDITERKETEVALERHLEGFKALNRIASEGGISLVTQVDLALELSLQHFGLALGIVSRVEGDDYVIRHHKAPEGALENGQVFPFKDTYCEITMGQNDVVGISHMSESSYAAHPCYKAFGLEAYIGAPYLVGGKVQGTVNFSSADPYAREFDQGDFDFMRLLARWVGSIYDRHEFQEQMAEKTMELEKSNDELQQFAYVASHDLQEPLRMVISYNQLLAKKYKGKLDAEADEFIGFAVDGAKRMQVLIKDLLDYSRVETKAGEPVSVDTGECLEDVVVVLQAATKDGMGNIAVKGDMPRVLADESQLKRLFQNLIGNALKYKSPERDQEIIVSVVGKGPMWQFCVKDNGIGIDPEFFERVFMIFQRLHTRDEYEGTGIGLAICHKIVERHGGKIWVESEPGEGSAFYFTLPRV